MAMPEDLVVMGTGVRTIAPPPGQVPSRTCAPGQAPPGYLPPGLVTIPDHRPRPLESSRKGSQMFNVFGRHVPDWATSDNRWRCKIWFAPVWRFKLQIFELLFESLDTAL